MNTLTLPKFSYTYPLADWLVTSDLLAPVLVVLEEVKLAVVTPVLSLQSPACL